MGTHPGRGVPAAGVSRRTGQAGVAAGVDLLSDFVDELAEGESDELLLLLDDELSDDDELSLVPPALSDAVEPERESVR